MWLACGWFRVLCSYWSPVGVADYVCACWTSGNSVKITRVVSLSIFVVAVSECRNVFGATFRIIVILALVS